MQRKKHRQNQENIAVEFTREKIAELANKKDRQN
jgi:hypothetical protein